MALHQMSHDLEDLANNMERGRKHWKHTGLSAEKRVSDAEAAMEKSKAKYDAAAEQWDKAKTGDRTGRFGLKKSGPQQEEEFSRKTQAADEDYAAKVRAAQASRQELTSSLRPQAVKALHELITECDTGLSFQLAKYATLNEKLLLGSGLCVSPLKGQSGERSLRDIASQIDNEGDYKQYVLGFQNKAGNRTSDIKYIQHPTLATNKTQQPVPAPVAQSPIAPGYRANTSGQQTGITPHRDSQYGGPPGAGPVPSYNNTQTTPSYGGNAPQLPPLTVGGNEPYRGDGPVDRHGPLSAPQGAPTSAQEPYSARPYNNGPPGAGLNNNYDSSTSARTGGPVAGGMKNNYDSPSSARTGGLAGVGPNNSYDSPTSARTGGPAGVGPSNNYDSPISARTGGPIAGGVKHDYDSPDSARTGGPASIGPNNNYDSPGSARTGGQNFGMVGAPLPSQQRGNEGFQDPSPAGPQSAQGDARYGLPMGGTNPVSSHAGAYRQGQAIGSTGAQNDRVSSGSYGGPTGGGPISTTSNMHTSAPQMSPHSQQNQAYQSGQAVGPTGAQSDRIASGPYGGPQGGGPISTTSNIHPPAPSSLGPMGGDGYRGQTAADPRGHHDGFRGAAGMGAAGAAAAMASTRNDSYNSASPQAARYGDTMPLSKQDTNGSYKGAPSVPQNGAGRGGPAAANPTANRGAPRPALPPLNPVFGVSLDELFRRDGSAVPMIVYQCIQAVDLFGLNTEGVYRTSGSVPVTNELKQLFDNGKRSYSNFGSIPLTIH